MLAKSPVLYVPAPPEPVALARRAATAGGVAGVTGAAAVGAYHAAALAWAWAATTLAALPGPLLFLGAAGALAVVGLPVSTWLSARRAVQYRPLHHCGGGASVAVNVTTSVSVSVR